MSLTNFGLYFIPKAGEFYDKGSKVVGYDIRSKKVISSPSFINSQWNDTNRQYGWHITITDAILIEKHKLAHVSQVVRELLACLREGNTYTFVKTSLGFWPETSQQVAMRLIPNRNVELLHDVLVAIIHPMGQGSVYYDQYMRDKDRYFQNDSRSRIAKTKRFYSPYILDEFTPHMTCVSPFMGTNHERVTLIHELSDMFAASTELRFDTLSMVAKDEGEEFYRIVDEFDLQHSRQ